MWGSLALLIKYDLRCHPNPAYFTYLFFLSFNFWSTNLLFLTIEVKNFGLIITVTWSTLKNKLQKGGGGATGIIIEYS